MVSVLQFVIAPSNGCGRAASTLLDLSISLTPGARCYMIEIREAEGTAVGRWDYQDKRKSASSRSSSARAGWTNLLKAHIYVLHSSATASTAFRSGRAEHRKQ